MKFANRLIAILAFVFSTTSFSAKWETSQIYWSDDVRLFQARIAFNPPMPLDQVKSGALKGPIYPAPLSIYPTIRCDGTVSNICEEATVQVLLKKPKNLQATIFENFVEDFAENPIHGELPIHYETPIQPYLLIFWKGSVRCHAFPRSTIPQLSDSANKLLATILPDMTTDEILDVMHNFCTLTELHDLAELMENNSRLQLQLLVHIDLAIGGTWQNARIDFAKK